LLGAYGAAVIAGLLFWYAFEHAWTYGAVKARAIASLSPRVAALFRTLGIGQVMRFASPSYGTLAPHPSTSLRAG
jgi:putative flippase GtrA